MFKTTKRNNILCFGDSTGRSFQSKSTVKNYSKDFDGQSKNEETTWKTKALMGEKY
jgi:hypothetical protein